MPSNFKKIDFNYEEMKLSELYFDETYINKIQGVITEGTKRVMGREFFFDACYENRPYIYNCLVTSIDGKIAFNDAPQGPLLVKENKYLENEGIVDYWILNLLRGSADAILVGTKSINAEIKTGGTGHCYDAEIELYRESVGKQPVPLRIIVSIGGNDINYSASEVQSTLTPTIFYTTEYGANAIQNNQAKEVIRIIDGNEITSLNFDHTKVYTIITGNQKINNHVGVFILKKMGINTLLVESPTITHILIKEQIMDELFWSYSCVYLGGDALSIGTECASFNASDHPHSKLVSIYMHSQHYLTFRHKLIY